MSVKMYKTYQSAPHDIKRYMIMQSFAFMPFLFMEGHFSLVCLAIIAQRYFIWGGGSAKIVLILTRGEGGVKNPILTRTTQKR